MSPSPSISDRLMQALDSGRAQAVRDAVNALGPRCLRARRDHDGATALHIALQPEIYRAGVVDALIDLGADTESTDRAGRTPLHYAAALADSRPVWWLINYGADPLARDARGVSVFTCIGAHGNRRALANAGLAVEHPERARQRADALLGAAGAGHMDMIETLLDSGVAIDGTAPGKQSPLGEALSHSQAACAGRLLRAGADPNALHAGHTPLALAAHADLPGIIPSLLAAGADPNLPGQGDRAPLAVAVLMDRPECVEALLAGGADPNGCPQAEETPLCAAAQRGRRPLMRRLLDAGADPNLSRAAGVLPLGQAAGGGRSGCAALLLAHSATVDAVDAAGGTALLAGARQVRAEVIETLIDAGADPDTPSRDGRTPLHCAAAKGHLPVIEALLAAGASADARDPAGLTPLCLLCTSPTRAGGRAARTARSLCAHGAQVNASSPRGPTPLHALASNKSFITTGTLETRIDILHALLEEGADPTARDDDGKTPLQIARRASQPPLFLDALRASCDTAVLRARTPRGTPTRTEPGLPSL